MNVTYFDLFQEIESCLQVAMYKTKSVVFINGLVYNFA